MQYRMDKYGNELSILGFGCMRFPMKAGHIDMAETEREILAAVEGGVNYFDTAYIYPGSEAALGEILERNGIREKVYIATKLPHYLIRVEVPYFIQNKRPFRPPAAGSTGGHRD